MVQSKSRSETYLTEPLSHYVLFGAFFIAAMMWGCICFVSRQPGSLALIQFLLCATVIVLCSANVIWHYHRCDQKIPFHWIFVTALVLRLMSLLGDPLFEDDYYRYLWDGFQTVTTNDPYTLAPAVFFDRDVPEIFEPILSLINYPDIATVYGPVSQWFFALGYLIAAGEIWPLQLLATIADMAVLCLLLRLGGGNALLLYAWSPLLLKEFSLTAHPDIYAILFMMLSIYAVHKHRAFLGGIALALACGSKVFAILVLPYLLTRGWSIKHWAMLCIGFGACLAAITAWFGSLTIWVPEGLLAMADSWLFNAPLYLLLLNVLQFQTIKGVLISLFLLYGLITFLRRLSRPIGSIQSVPGTQIWAETTAGFRGDWLYGLFLLSLPVINPWYMAWVLPFAVLNPKYLTWTASYAVLLSYWHGGNIATSSADSAVVSVNVMAIEYALLLLIPLTALAATHVSRKRKAVRTGDATC